MRQASEPVLELDLVDQAGLELTEIRLVIIPPPIRLHFQVLKAGTFTGTHVWLPPHVTQLKPLHTFLSCPSASSAYNVVMPTLACTCAGQLLKAGHAIYPSLSLHTVPQACTHPPLINS